VPGFTLEECVKFIVYKGVCVCVCAVLLLLFVVSRRVWCWCGCSGVIFIPISLKLFTWLERLNEIHTQMEHGDLICFLFLLGKERS